jgi:hypothetical protein
MAAGDTLKGRRIPADEFRNAGGLESPGDYCGPIMGYTGDKPAVFFLKPNARDADAPQHARSVQHVTSPPHTFTEESDGSLTIKASISDTRREDPLGLGSDGWHGFLTRGVWSQV